MTLVRLESEQSPRYETLVAIARGPGQPVGELLVRVTLGGRSLFGVRAFAQ